MQKDKNIRAAFRKVRADVDSLKVLMQSIAKETTAGMSVGDDSWFAAQTALIIAPHPDDEILGCGGLIHRIKQAGGKVYVLCVCVGNLAQYGSTSSTEKRLNELKSVMEYLKVDGYHLAYISDDYHLLLDKKSQKELITMIERDTPVSLSKVNPTLVALPYQFSSNQDHRAVFEAGFSALRPRPDHLKPTAKVVLMYEQPDVFWGMGDFKPNFFVDISSVLDVKLRALSLYSTQIHPHPHPVSLENVKNIALARGIHVGKTAVEAFQCLRFLI